MSLENKIEQVVVLKSKFNLEDKHILFGVARLMPDRIVLKGWFFKKIIMLDSIREVRWSSDLIVLGLESGRDLEMIIQSAALWKYELQARCGLTDNSSAFQDLKGPSKDSIIEADSFTKQTERADIRNQDRTPQGDAFAIPVVSVSTNSGAEPMAANGTKESTYRIKSLFAQDRPQKDH